MGKTSVDVIVTNGVLMIVGSTWLVSVTVKVRSGSGAKVTVGVFTTVSVKVIKGVVAIVGKSTRVDDINMVSTSVIKPCVVLNNVVRERELVTVLVRVLVMVCTGVTIGISGVGSIVSVAVCKMVL